MMQELIMPAATREHMVSSSAARSCSLYATPLMKSLRVFIAVRAIAVPCRDKRSKRRRRECASAKWSFVLSSAAAVEEAEEAEEAVEHGI